ncbi:MAG: GNAT family N-acetyltransferase [Sulfolobales archaeon]|nr:N-acetyltransferase [Sulfolobales archaeon]MDW7970186.1 GNAT family N-acetyltransferase [Sulfolobales archaeon]
MLMVSMDLEVKYTSQVIYVKFGDGSKAFLGYKIEGDKMHLLETYTPPQHRGMGVAKLLIEKALELAKEKGIKVVPVCSYSIQYFMRNPGVRHLLAEPYVNMSDDELSRYYEERLSIERSKK